MCDVTKDDPNHGSTMCRVLVRETFVQDVWHYYVDPSVPDAPYYEVMQDMDTERVDFINPKNPSEDEELVRCFVPRNIPKVIANDMRKRGFDVPDEIPDVE